MTRRRWLLVLLLAAALACGGLGLALPRRTPPLATIVHGGESALALAAEDF